MLHGNFNFREIFNAASEDINIFSFTIRIIDSGGFLTKISGMSSATIGD